MIHISCLAFSPSSPSCLSSLPFFPSSGSGGRKVRQHPSAGGSGISGVWDDLGCSCGGGAGHTHPGRMVLQGWKLCATRILPQTQSPNAQELPELCKCSTLDSLCRVTLPVDVTEGRPDAFVWLSFVCEWIKLSFIIFYMRIRGTTLHVGQWVKFFLSLVLKLCALMLFPKLFPKLFHTCKWPWKVALKNLFAQFILHKTSKVCI